MRSIIYSFITFSFLLISVSLNAVAEGHSIYDFAAKDLDGKPLSLSSYKNSVILIVNTASKCGFTPQYKDLEEAYLRYKDSGFVVLGFPSNDFGDTEPGTNEEIKKFCKLRFNVTFPVAQKGVVSGPNKSDLFKFLTENAAKDLKGEIEWNFEKFLIDRSGKLVGRYGSNVNPLSAKITSKIDEALAQKS